MLCPQVGDGTSDFTPSPEESRQFVRAGYRPSATPTLMVQFADDSIDQTPEMLDILLSCSGGAGELNTCCRLQVMIEM